MVDLLPCASARVLVDDWTALWKTNDDCGTTTAPNEDDVLLDWIEVGRLEDGVYATDSLDTKACLER